MARIIQSTVARRGFAARIGGDELSIILDGDGTEDDACAYAAPIGQKQKELLSLANRKLHLGASFGVAHTASLTEHGRDIKFFADTALYKAKENGRN